MLNRERESARNLSSKLIILLLRLSTLIAAIFFAALLPIKLVGAASSSVLIASVYPDTYLSGEPDEAFQLINASANPVDLTNWTVTDFEGNCYLERLTRSWSDPVDCT
jgi:hypothetical protein